MDTYVHLVSGAVCGTLAVQVWESWRQQKGQPPLRQSTRLTAGLVVGIASHVALDTLPHADYLVDHGALIPQRFWYLREALAMLACFVLLYRWTGGRRRWLALAAGLGGSLPDAESLLIGTGLMDKAHALSPSHNGLLPHGVEQGWLGPLVEFGLLLAALVYFYSGRKKGDSA